MESLRKENGEPAHQQEAAEDKEDAQGERRLGVAGDVGFDQRGHEGEGQHAHEHEESAAGTVAKGFDARAASREEPTRAQGQ